MAISDTVIGMNESIQARIFEPFFSTKGVGQGTGLGLATCYGIIKQSGGHIMVQSAANQGATFRIYLPQVEFAAPLPLLRPTTPDPVEGKETILLVEEDPALREMAAQLLGRLGYVVLTTSSSSGALNLAQHAERGPIDLLVTDVTPTQMTGQQLAAQIHSLHPTAKILFTSIYSGNALLDPTAAFLQKPFTPSALISKIREALDVGRTVPFSSQ